ncbi:DUF2141 domain-containing protein [Maribacter sp. 2307ULW6-5]|uniref:DUF2141 domain-containing protein n=1 Tax=Maribacter sp. 2307ULW6-5 TaxID=3386275 RepID=UPI0039BC2355
MTKKFSMMVFALLATGSALAQHTVTLTVKGVGSTKGKVSAALYTDQRTWLKFDQVFMATSEAAEQGTTVLTFTDVPQGNYAIAVFHDQNGNGKLDTNMLGIPKEPVAFSKAKMKMFGPPSFEEASFMVDGDVALTIRLND